jgi:hypothetical protein
MHSRAEMTVVSLFWRFTALNTRGRDYASDKASVKFLVSGIPKALMDGVLLYP